MNTQQLPYKTSLESAARRKKQFWWQIFLPVVAAAIIMIVLAVLSTRASNAQISQWGNISTMIVVLPVLLTCLVGLAITVAMIVGLSKLLKVLPQFFTVVLIRLDQARAAIQRVADKAAAPVIRTSSTAAAVRTVFTRNNHSSQG